MRNETSAQGTGESTQTEQFLAHVQERAGLDAPDEARQATHAVLTVFSRLRLAGEADDVAAQLPDEIAKLLTATGELEDLSADVFVARIQAELDSSHDEADQAAGAVLSTVAEAVSKGQRLAFINAVPSEYTRFVLRT